MRFQHMMSLKERKENDEISNLGALGLELLGDA